MLIYIFIIGFIIKYLYYFNIKVDIKCSPDIIINPGGNMGFYNLGICHYIKNHYDISNKVVHGFSSGSINSIFLALNKKYDNLFLSKLFSLNLNTNMKLSYLMSETIKIMNDINIKELDMKNKYIITLNNLNTIKANNIFLNKESLINCCKSSCFIPLVSSNQFVNYYDNYLCFDSGFVFKKYKQYIGINKKLFIGYKMFQRFKYTLNGYGLVKHNYSVYDLYLLGYKDSENNKCLLDYYFNSSI
jgi:hypothetical protein|tara:strand:- start:250 stop:984 length:735 start_codon:yes stop_codon:yes gene_type:complete